jgi:hypothetical protein
MGNPDAPGGDGPSGDETSAPWANKITTPVDAETALADAESGPQADENTVTIPLGQGADPEQLGQPQVVSPDPQGEGFSLNLAALPAGTAGAGSTVNDGWGDAPVSRAQSLAAPRMNVGLASGVYGGLVH